MVGLPRVDRDRSLPLTAHIKNDLAEVAADIKTARDQYTSWF